MKDVLDLIARIMISTIFLFEAFDSIVYYKSTQNTMTEYNVLWRQDILLIGAIILLIFGGLLILIGYRAKFGAVLLLCYWIPVTLIVHSFWDAPEEIRRVQSILFMKDIAIIGGLLMLLVHGSGKYSVKRMLAVMRLPKD